MNHNIVTIENDQIRLSYSLLGGICKETFYKQAQINTLHEKIGHFIPFDRWGPPSLKDKERGIPFHGEASKTLWRLGEHSFHDSFQRVEMSVYLPIVKFSLERTVTLYHSSGVFQVDELIKNETEEKRVFNLVQHVTFGSPFLNNDSIIDTNASLGFSQDPSNDLSHIQFSWPYYLSNGNLYDQRFIGRAIPPTDSVCSYIYPADNGEGWVTIINPERGIVAGYLWSTADYPWLNSWIRLKEGLLEARALEFGTTGLHKELETLVELKSILNNQLYEELDAHSFLKKSYFGFVAKVPQGCSRISALRKTSDEIVLSVIHSSSTEHIRLLIGDLK